MPWSSDARWRTIARNSSRATVARQLVRPELARRPGAAGPGRAGGAAAAPTSTGVIARRMSSIGSASGEDSTESARDPRLLVAGAGPAAGRRERGARGPGAGPAPPRPRRDGPRRSASSRRSGSAMSRSDGMTASTKPIRPDAGLEVEAAGVVVDEVLDERLGLAPMAVCQAVGRLAHDLVGVLAVGQPGDADVLELDARVVSAWSWPMSPASAVTPSVPGLLAGGVDVVGERDPARVAGQQRDLAGREGRAEAGDDVVEAGLVGHQRVGVALDDDRLACLADRALGLVDEVERPALVEERRRRGVEVLGPVALEEPAAEPDRVAVLVADREEDPRRNLS